MEARQLVLPGRVRGLSGFSSKARTRLSSSTEITPKRRASSAGTSMAAMLRSARFMMCWFTIWLTSMR